MKNVFLILATLSFCLSSIAETTNPVERLVAAINFRISEANKKLEEENESKRYCEKLSDDQISYLQENIILENNDDPSKIVYKNLNNVPVDDFIGVVAGKLNCYRLVSESQGRRSLGGVILNQVGYRRDMALLRDAFSDMTGKKITGRERVAWVLGL